jgi:hypothetical protein
MELSHLNQSLYPRPVTAAVEGHSRQDERERELTPGTSAAVKRRASTDQRRHSERIRREESQRRLHNEQAMRRHHADQELEIARNPNASSFGEQMAVASRQARHLHTKRGYTPPALVSARGREANRRYLDASMSNQARFIDEVV